MDTPIPDASNTKLHVPVCAGHTSLAQIASRMCPRHQIEVEAKTKCYHFLALVSQTTAQVASSYPVRECRCPYNDVLIECYWVFERIDLIEIIQHMVQDMMATDPK